MSKVILAFLFAVSLNACAVGTCNVRSFDEASEAERSMRRLLDDGATKRGLFKVRHDLIDALVHCTGVGCEQLQAMLSIFDLHSQNTPWADADIAVIREQTNVGWAEYFQTERARGCR